MQDHHELAELLAKCALGNRAAFAALYQKTSAQLFALCLRIVRKEELAEEVLQDAFVSIWKSADSYRQDKASAMTWMATIVRNRCLDKLRRHKRDSLHDDIDDMAVEDTVIMNPMAEKMADETARLLQDCLATLKPDQRQCVMLAYYQGLSHEELSHYLATPIGTVKSWIRRGLQKLKGCLE